MNLFFVLTIIIILGAAIIIFIKKKGFSRRQLVCVGLVLISVILAYLLKYNIELPAVNAPIPFYKVANLTEYGYASILGDLVGYAVPFIAIGFFIKPAFGGVGLIASLITGLLSAVALNIPRIVTGGVFIADEYVYAALGSAVGYSLYCIIVSLMKSKLLDKLDLPVPDKKARKLAYGAFAAVYFFIALVMIFDYGETYAGIQFFDNSVELPKQISYEFEPSVQKERVNIYAPSTQPVVDRTLAVAAAMGMSSEVVAANGVYTVTEGSRMLTYTESGSWTYEDSSEPEKLTITQEEAVALTTGLFQTHQVLTVSVDKVTDVIEKTGDGEISGYDVYLTTAIGHAPIIGSNTIMVSVKGNRIALIRKYDEDLTVESQVGIMSQKDAVSKIEHGECAYTLFNEAESIRILNCELAYMANSSKGYYLPIWRFDAIAKNGAEETSFEIYVEAKR